MGLQMCRNIFTSLPVVVSAAAATLGCFSGALVESTRLKTADIFAFCCTECTLLQTAKLCQVRFHSNETERVLWCIANEIHFDTWTIDRTVASSLVVGGIFFTLFTAATGYLYFKTHPVAAQALLPRERPEAKAPPSGINLVVPQPTPEIEAPESNTHENGAEVDLNALAPTPKTNEEPPKGDLDMNSAV